MGAVHLGLAVMRHAGTAFINEGESMGGRLAEVVELVDTQR